MSEETKPPPILMFERLTPRHAFAAMVMHKLLTVKKEGGKRKVECDIRACWDLADAMVAAGDASKSS